MPEHHHQYVRPPYLLLANQFDTASGDVVCVWHLRVAQPGIAAMDQDATHSVEHWLIYGLRPHGVYQAAPMGCGTGYYIVSPLMEYGEMARYLADVLQQIVTASDDNVPWADDAHCGFADRHSQWGARRIAQWLLLRRDEWPVVGTDVLV